MTALPSAVSITMIHGRFMASFATTSTTERPHARRRFHARAALILAALALSFSAGCGTTEKHFALQGQVITKSAETSQLTVKHDTIPGFMPAMTMPYPVKDAQALGDVQPGDQITAD